MFLTKICLELCQNEQTQTTQSPFQSNMYNLATTPPLCSINIGGKTTNAKTTYVFELEVFDNRFLGGQECILIIIYLVVAHI